MKTKRKILAKLASVLIVLALFTITIFPTLALATSSGSVGTAEVKTATDNIKKVITSIAMPLGRSSYFCKYCSCCFKNDCKC